MKKIGFLYGGSAGRGGLSTYLKLLFKNVKSNEFELILLSIGEWETSKAIEKSGAKVIYLPKSKIFSIKTLLDLSGIIKKEEISVLITAGMVSNFYARKVSFFTGSKIITTIHSDWKNDYPGIFKKTIYYLSDRLLRFKTTKYIAVSNYLKESLIKEGVPAKKIEVIHNGVDVSKNTKYQIPNTKYLTVGSVGRLHKTKGFDVLIKAMKLLPSEYVLKIWGDGVEKEALNKQIKELGLSKRVSLMGRAENVSEALGEIDIYVQPSRMEGFGLTVAEAMMAGLPVLVSPNGSLPEIVNDAATGLVAKNLTPEALAKEITELGAAQAFAQKLAKAGQEYAKKEFGVENWSRKMTKLLEEAVI